jgi:hypothetical protein
MPRAEAPPFAKSLREDDSRAGLNQPVTPLQDWKSKDFTLLTVVSALLTGCISCAPDRTYKFLLRCASVV